MLGLKTEEKQKPSSPSLSIEAYQEANFGIKPERSWQEAVVRYLYLGKQHLRSFKDVRRSCAALDPYLGNVAAARDHGRCDLVRSPRGVEAGQSTGDGESLSRHDSQPVFVWRAIEWQWIDSIPKIRLLPGEMERDRWLTHEEADRLIDGLPFSS